MPHYPIFLDLQDRPVLVVGAGPVALRKTRGLLASGARVTVVAPAALSEFEKLPIRLLLRPFRPSDLKDAVLVFAATDDRAVNHRISQLAQARHIPANIADAPAECDFVVPARIQRGDLQIAISTSGRSPRLSAALRQKLESILP